MNTLYFTQRTGSRILAVVALLSLIASLVPMQTFANHDPFGGVLQTSVQFCHSTGNNGGFNSPNSSITATGGQINIPNGHAGQAHTLDIIPPFHFDGGTYAGQNWNPSTQDIWASGNCNGDGVVAPTNATLTTNKVVVGGDDAVTAFGFKVNGGSAVSFDTDGSVPQTVNLGTYAVVENGVTAGKVTIGADEYAVTYSAGCSGTLTASGATCTITNTFVPLAGPTTGTLNITKVISGIQGILASAFSFIVNGGASVPFDATDNTNSVPSVPAGAYTVVEAGVTGGQVVVGPNTYNVGYSAGCASTMIAGGTADCTITNTFVPPTPTTGTIIVDKVTNPALDTQSFAFTTTGTGYTGFSLTDTAAVNSQTVEAGTYSVAETVPTGWTQTSATCSDGSLITAISLQAGETITCTFNNLKDGATVVNGCTNPLATNYNPNATAGNPTATDCDFDYVSVCPLPSTNLLTNASFEDPVVNGGNGTSFGAGFFGVFASITDWSATNSIELWNNILNLASDGNQSTELGVANSTTISQTAVTIPGATYELRFDFAARSDNSSEAENSVIAAADGNSVVATSTNNTAFTTYGATFVAGDASTDISFADNGVNNGVGTVIDNAVLCLVQPPAPTQGTLNVIKTLVGTTTVDESAFSFSLNGAASTSFDGTDGVNTLTLAAGTYDVVETSAPGYTTTYNNCDNVVVTAGQTSTCTITNTLITSTPQVCSVNVVSNLTNTVNATGTVIVENQPGVWVDNIVGSLAQWIWGASSASPISGTVDETQTFTKTFVWNGPVTGATLKLASDNMYSVTLNGTEVASGSDEDNFTSVDTIVNISDNIVQGTNTLAISVTNDANNQTTLAGNPAGLIYDLTVVGNTQDNCTQVPGGGGGNTDLTCSISASDTSIRRGRDVDLTWTSTGGATSATLTGEGTVPTNGTTLVEDIDDDTTFTLTVTDGDDTASCSVSVNTTSGGGGGGGGGGNNNNNNNGGPDGDVLGASDDADTDEDEPGGLVLGDQVDAVPTGAPNTGKGGVSTLVLGQLLAMPRRRNHN